MTDLRMRSLSRLSASGDAEASLMVHLVWCQRDGHKIDGTHWAARGDLRNVHGCSCGAYNRTCPPRPDGGLGCTVPA